MDNKPINIFWTSGWDSTFRVLQLIKVEKKVVQPIFVVRAQDSVGFEVKALHDIRRILFRKYPELKNLLLPIKFIDIHEIRNKEKFESALEEIRKQNYLAKQYTFLAALCEQANLKNVELSIIKNGSVTKLLKPYIQNDALENQFTKNSIQAAELKLIFKWFKFPLINYTKTDMEIYAKKYGFLEILYKSWFCATPKNMKPCGFCGPCIDAIELGFSHRIPLHRRIVSILHLPFRRYYRKRFKNYG